MSTQRLGVPLEGFAEFSRKVAAEGAVLLKNEGQVLPLQPHETVSVLAERRLIITAPVRVRAGAFMYPIQRIMLGGLRDKKNITVNEELADCL